MRAPGHPQGCAVMEAAMDDLADKLGIDPLEFRLKNLAAGDFHTPIYEGEVRLAELIGCARSGKPRGQNRRPRSPRPGHGMHQWGGGGTQDKKVSCTINPDGSVELKTATQDIGTGARTILAVIAAEVLGLRPTDIISNIGNSSFPPGQPSGGRRPLPRWPPRVWTRRPGPATPCSRRSPRPSRPPPRTWNSRTASSMSRASPSWAGRKPAASWAWPPSPKPAGAEGLASVGVGGCQFAEVAVDIETGVVRVKKIVAIQDSGLIIDRLTWESQVYGGVIMGLNYGLFEGGSWTRKPA